MDLIKLHKKIQKNKEAKDKCKDILKQLSNNLSKYIGQPCNDITRMKILEENARYFETLTEENIVTANINGILITPRTFQINSSMFINPG